MHKIGFDDNSDGRSANVEITLRCAIFGVKKIANHNITCCGLFKTIVGHIYLLQLKYNKLLNGLLAEQ